MYAAYNYDVVPITTVPDAYGAAYVLDSTTRFIHITIWDQPVMMRFSYDGVAYGDEFEIDPDDPPVELPMAVSSFVIRNKTAAVVARAQIAGFW